MSKSRDLNLSRSFVPPSSNHLYISPSTEDSFGLVLTDVKPEERFMPENTENYKNEVKLNLSSGCFTAPSANSNMTFHRSELIVPTVRPPKQESSNRAARPAPVKSKTYFGSYPESFLTESTYQLPSPHPRRKTYETGSNLIDLNSPPTSPLRHTSREHLKPFPGESGSGSNSDDELASRLGDISVEENTGVDFDIGSLVEVCVDEFTPLFGVVRWIGRPDRAARSKVLVGIELEEEFDEAGDGYYCGKRYFDCPAKRALFVSPDKCKIDSRFGYHPGKNTTSSETASSTRMDFGAPDCPPIGGAVPPVSHPHDVTDFCGKFRGIQGHHNSCYLDATIFSMFTFTSVFDYLLYRPPNRSDIPQYSEVQRLLREEIVNPLRQNFYVRADKVMKLRRLLQSLSSVTGLTNEEKDPEEFLHCLLAQTLRAEPFLKLHTGQEAFHHQLFVEKDEQLLLPSVQQLFEQSFLSSSIKLKQIPPCLILQMPRFGKSYKMYPYVLPSLLLDITDILENSPRQCIVCGRLAELECPQCLGQCGNGLESIAFCNPCLSKAHSHRKRSSHKAVALKIPHEFAALQEHCAVPRVYMELFAVVCIATSHYVTFAKCGPGPDAPWCFFDSMADRRGEQDGYNIPEVVPCPDLPRWLSEDWDRHTLLSENDKPDDNIPQYVRRLFSDAYMCLYQSPDLLLYR